MADYFWTYCTHFGFGAPGTWVLSHLHRKNITKKWGYKLIGCVVRSLKNLFYQAQEKKLRVESTFWQDNIELNFTVQRSTSAQKDGSLRKAAAEDVTILIKQCSI